MKVIRDIAPGKWNQIADSCRYATYFHTREWAKIIESSLENHEIATLLFELPDGREVVLPLMCVRVGPGGVFKTLQSMVPGVYGGPISAGEVADQDLAEIAAVLAGEEAASLSVIGNPFSGFQMPGPFIRHPMSTQVIDLGEGFTEIWKKFTKGHKYSAKKSKKLGVVIELAKSRQDYLDYYRVYQLSLRRWGSRATSCYPEALFENLRQEDSAKIRLWLARLDSKVIAGALVFCHNTHAVWWHGAADGDYFKHYPSNLLQTEIIRSLCEEGFEIYDFNPSGGHQGVFDFKHSFGPRVLKFDRYTLTASIVYRIYNRLRG